jgi:5'-nucleotidase
VSQVVARRILVTNDDGVESPGIRLLATGIAALGHDVFVVAPMVDRSGVGSALGAVPDVPVSIQKEYVDGIEFTGIDGNPALAVTMARLGVFGPRPWCVVAGINYGPNTGRSILHSGTVCAALTAASLGMSGLAVSIDASEPIHLQTAADLAVAATEWLVTAQKRTVLNLNVPDLPLGQLRGVRWARLAAYGRIRRTAATNATPALSVEASQLPLDPNTDEGRLAARFASLTPLTGITAIEDDSAAIFLDSTFGEPSDAH